MVAVGTVGDLRAGGTVRLRVDVPDAADDWADGLAGVKVLGRTGSVTARCAFLPWRERPPGIPMRSLCYRATHRIRSVSWNLVQLHEEPRTQEACDGAGHALAQPRAEIA